MIELSLILDPWKMKTLEHMKKKNNDYNKDDCKNMFKKYI